MVTSELTGEDSMGVLLVFLVFWRRGRYIVPDQQGDMIEISLIISSAATMVYCTIAKVRCKCACAKMSTSAGSYHDKIQVGIMTQLLLHAAAASYHGTIPPVAVDCDNNGVVFHGNNSS